VERSAAPDDAPDRQGGCQAVSCREEEEPDPRPAGGPPPALAAWGASACARRDATVGEADLRPQPADGVEKLVALAPDGQVQDVSRWRSERRAAAGAARVAWELCKPAAVRSGERSCAALEATGQPDAAQWEPSAKRSPKLTEALRRMGPELPAASRAVSSRWLAATEGARLAPMLTAAQPPKACPQEARPPAASPSREPPAALQMAPLETKLRAG